MASSKQKGTSGPFGQSTRMRVLNEYFESAGPVTPANAWEHVYRCLLWMNRTAALAHIYDSNHMQPGGGFHGRAVRFTDALCSRWGIARGELPQHIDVLFQGCVTAWKKAQLLLGPPSGKIDDTELVDTIEGVLRTEGVPDALARDVALKIESEARDFFTIGNKRKNALGEGFEDLLFILLQRASAIPAEKITLRQPVSKLPGFRKQPLPAPGQKKQREPSPDIAIIDDGITHVITTAKWSMRQDRETQFLAEYNSYQRNKVQETELTYTLITNEFDVARLNNVARAMPGGDGGYIFHQIYHINPELLVATQGDRIGQVANWMGVGKIRSLADFLTEMRGRFGVP